MSIKTNKSLAAIFLFFMTVTLIGCATTSYLSDNYNIAKSAYERENYPKAIEYFELYVKNNPQSIMNEVALYYLADSYSKNGNSSKAKEKYNQLINKYKTGFWVEQAQKDLKEI